MDEISSQLRSWLQKMRRRTMTMMMSLTMMIVQALSEAQGVLQATHRALAQVSTTVTRYIT